MVRSFVLAACLATLAAANGCRSPAGQVTDLDGRSVDPLANAKRATVLVFVSVDCPVSNRYAPEVRRLHEKFSPRGVTFQLVYPSANLTASSIREHVRAYSYPFGAVRDPQHVLVARAGVTVMSEVAVFQPDGKLAYRGRIDDRQVDFATTRPEPTRRDLEQALEAVLAGRAVETRTTSAVGCAIPPAR